MTPSAPRRRANPVVALLAGALAIAVGAAQAASPPTGLPRTPEAAAQSLYQAWRSHSRKAGAKVATRDAVSKLLGTRWQVMGFEGCRPREEEGGFECLYVRHELELSLAMVVEGGASVGGYNVTSVSFSSEQ